MTDSKTISDFPNTQGQCAGAEEVSSDEGATRISFLESAKDLCRRLKVHPKSSLLVGITQNLAKRIETFGAEEELLRLEKHGVRRETLAIGAMFFLFSPLIDHVARSMFGDNNERKRKSKVLYEAIDILEGLGIWSGAVSIESFELSRWRLRRMR